MEASTALTFISWLLHKTSHGIPVVCRAFWTFTAEQGSVSGTMGKRKNRVSHSWSPRFTIPKHQGQMDPLGFNLLSEFMSSTCFLLEPAFFAPLVSSYAKLYSFFIVERKVAGLHLSKVLQLPDCTICYSIIVLASTAQILKSIISPLKTFFLWLPELWFCVSESPPHGWMDGWMVDRHIHR